MNFILEQIRLRRSNHFPSNSSVTTTIRKDPLSLQIVTSPLRMSEKKKRKTTSDFLLFSSLYKKSQQRKKMNSSTLPSIQMNKKTIDLSLGRSIMFTDPNYPEPFNVDVNHLVLRPKIFVQKKKRNIIDYLDNEDIMMTYLNKKDYDILNDYYKNEMIIHLLKDKVINFDSNPSYCKKAYFYTKQFSPIKISLSINSISFEITNLQTNESTTLNLPLSIIPFYYAIPFDIFLLFITKIIEMSSDVNKIKIDHNSVIKYVKEISNDIDLFNTNSSYCSNSLSKLSYDWLIEDCHFKITIIPPRLEISQENKFTISKLIGKGLMCTLILRAYENWDNLALCYLSSFKNFRYAIGILYGQKVSKSFSERSHFYEVDEIASFGAIKKNVTSLKSNSFSFFITLNQDMYIRNFFFTFFSYTVNVILLKQEYNFDISFENMKFWFTLKEDYPITSIVKKCLFITNERAELNINLLKGIPYEKMENFFASKDSDQASSLHSLIVSEQEPRLEWRDILSVSHTNVNEITNHNYVIKSTLLCNLIDNELKGWPIIFNQFGSDLGKEVEKKYSRRLSIMKTMKM